MSMARHCADVQATAASEWEESSRRMGMAGRRASVVPASAAHARYKTLYSIGHSIRGDLV